MSNYSGRHGPNVSQYLRDLNTISPQADILEESSLNFEEDLNIFTNTQFFDIDSGQNTDFQAQPAKPEGKAPHSGTTSEDVSAAPSVIGEMPNLDFMSGESTALAIFPLHSISTCTCFFRFNSPTYLSALRLSTSHSWEETRPGFFPFEQNPRTL